MSADQLERFVFDRAPVRGNIVLLQQTWQQVLQRQDYPPAVRLVLGELLAAAALLYATLKFQGSLVMQLQGSGPLQLLVVECAQDLGLRATARWQEPLPPAATLPQLAGDGRFAISLVPADGGHPYQGIVPLQGQRVQDILEGYMTRSEQLDTRLWLAADGERAAGLLLQKLPEAGGDDADAWNRATLLADTLSREELLGVDQRQLLHRLYHEETLRVFGPQAACFRCRCSRQRTADMVRMLGQEQAQQMLAEQGVLDITCEFCNARYRFDAVDAGQIFAGDRLAAASDTRH